MKGEATAVPGRPGAGGNVRPRPQQQLKLLPVVLPRQIAWNARVARWAAA